MSIEGVNALIESQLRVIESDSVLMRVVTEKKLGQDPEFGRLGFLSSLSNWIAALFGAAPDNPISADLRAMRALKRDVSTKRAEKTFVVDVFAASQDREKAAQLANAVAEAYLRDQSENAIRRFAASWRPHCRPSRGLARRRAARRTRGRPIQVREKHHHRRRHAHGDGSTRRP